MAFGVNQIGNSTPAWVVKTVAASTVVLQLLTPVIAASTVLDQSTKDVIDLTCKLVNIAVAGLAVFFGNSSTE